MYIDIKQRKSDKTKRKKSFSPLLDARFWPSRNFKTLFFFFFSESSPLLLILSSKAVLPPEFVTGNIVAPAKMPRPLKHEYVLFTDDTLIVSLV